MPARSLKRRGHPRPRARAHPDGSRREGRRRREAAAEGLDKVNAVRQAIRDEHGTCRHGLEQVTEKALALLTGLRAITLMLRNPPADNRAMIRATDPDRHFEAITAIGYLLMQLRDLVPDDAAERWMREDARGPRYAHAARAEDEMAACVRPRGPPWPSRSIRRATRLGPTRHSTGHWPAAARSVLRNDIYILRQGDLRNSSTIALTDHEEPGILAHACD